MGEDSDINKIATYLQNVARRFEIEECWKLSKFESIPKISRSQFSLVSQVRVTRGSLTRSLDLTPGD